jgi:hypothetical protein
LWKNSSENGVDIALMALVVSLGMTTENSFEWRREFVGSSADFIDLNLR